MATLQWTNNAVSLKGSRFAKSAGRKAVKSVANSLVYLIVAQ